MGWLAVAICFEGLFVTLFCIWEVGVMVLRTLISI